MHPPPGHYFEQYIFTAYRMIGENIFRCGLKAFSMKTNWTDHEIFMHAQNYVPGWGYFLHKREGMNVYILLQKIDYVPTKFAVR